MDCKQCEDLTADYLGCELDAESRNAFEAHLEACVDCARRVGELSESVRVLDRLESIPHHVARKRTVQFRVVRRRSLTVRTAITLLKTAAVLVLGVWLGRSSIDPAPTQDHVDTPPGQLVVASTESVHPGWLRLARDVGSQPSSLAGQLALLARSKN